MIPFAKMHGCGNDFVVVEGHEIQVLRRDSSRFVHWVRRICDRRYGLGADGVLAYSVQRNQRPHRVRMEYWNADGTRAEMCGNGARCVVRIAHSRGQTDDEILLETDAGIRPARVLKTTEPEPIVEVDMGAPIWEASRIPTGLPLQSAPGGDVPGDHVEISQAVYEVFSVSMGNPHAIVFLPNREQFETVDLSRDGRLLAEHSLFPQGANASFVHLRHNELYLRVWERGSGPTLACGTASCAALAVACRTGRLETESARVHLPGGPVQVRQDEAGSLWLMGEAVWIAEGTLHQDFERLPARPESAPHS